MKVLLVVDMQNDFINGSLGTKEAEQILPFVEKRIKDSTEDIIIFTQDTHYSDYLETQEGKRLPIEHCMHETHGWEIHPSLINAWKKNKYTFRLDDIPNNSLSKDTFGSKDLIELLTELADEEPIEEVEIIGLCTDICVISNALLIKAYFPETTITVNSSGCAGVSPESHNTAINAMRACQVDII